ncbi:MAG TPA: HAD-IC family P-type ATPase [Candidatus Limnocylindria bacterium]|nr:HAD-IC family P-type ATPase [Candidatus Limnocylindria bacterium]
MASNDLAQRRFWHMLDRAALESLLGAGARGLARAEVAARLARHGPNQLEETPPTSVWALLLHQFTSPLIYILLVAAVVTLALREYADAIVIAAVLALNAVIGFMQERKAEMSVRSLMHLVAPHARVIREGREWDVESRDLVPGDLVLLESGGRVPADLRLVSATALLVDESLFTGESVPVTKTTATLDREDLVVGDRTNMTYAGSVVASGRGRGYVVATGGTTELGAIAHQVRTGERAETPLQHRMTRFSHVVGIVVVVAAVAALALGVARGEALADMFIVAVALAVSAIPEGLPVVFTITLALGVRRMARRNAIIRRLPAVETLGSTTVIGSDKTGTLTENRMTVQKIWAGGRTFTVTETGPRSADAVQEGGGPVEVARERPLYLTLLAGVLTNEAGLVPTGEGFDTQGDPTEAALLVAAARLGVDPAAARARYDVHAEIPFEPERQYSASLRVSGDEHVVFVKGAPERVLRMCTRLLTAEGPVDLDPDRVLEAAGALASEGLRLLGMATGVWTPAPDAGRPHEPAGLTFVGLQGSMDPPRAGVREAIAGCQESGIRVVMITGDHVATARAIGEQLGIGSREAPALSGAELGAMDDAALRARVPEVAIYARVAPEHKLRVVQALQSQGEVVAVTGDGVNDAPALKAAEIGIAMGRSGTDVAREASDMVLADDNFASIYAAVQEGRITFDNLRKVTFFLISTGAAEVLAILTALLVQWPLPFLPAQILWLNLVTNGLQDVALAFEPGEPGVLQRPPRSRDEGVISRLLWERTLLAGVVMAAGTLLLFWWELSESGEVGRAQTVALTTMVLFQVFHVGNCRSERRSLFALSPWSNPFLFAATAAALLVHVAALYLPPTQLLLRVEPLDAGAWIRMTLVASTILIAVEAHKLLRRRRGAADKAARGPRAAGGRPNHA